MNTDDLLAERETTHGPFEFHAQVTQSLKSVMYSAMVAREGKYKKTPLTIEMREALDMIQHKVGRIIAGDATEVDHWDDIAGYARLVSTALNQQAEKDLQAKHSATPLPPDADYVEAAMPVNPKTKPKH